MVVSGACSNCGCSSNALRRCAGTCGGAAVFCGKECQISYWKAGHKNTCKKKKAESAGSQKIDLVKAAKEAEQYQGIQDIRCHPLNPHVWQDIDLAKEARDRAERIRLGTSDTDPSRQNQAANAFNQRGLAAKRNGNVQEAIMLYSQAIQLDGFNHHFFHNRSAAYKLLDNFDMALIDASRSLQLKDDNPIPWCNVIMAYFYTYRPDCARAAMELARAKVDRSDPYYHFYPQQCAYLEQQFADKNRYPVGIKHIVDQGDTLAFVYSQGMYLRGNQDVLAVDIPTKDGTPLKLKMDMYRWCMNRSLFNELFGGRVPAGKQQIKPGKALKLGTVLKGHDFDAIAIPVEDKAHINLIKLTMMGYGNVMFSSGGIVENDDRMADPGYGGIALLKIFKKGTIPKGYAVTKDEAKAYVDAVVSNAHDCQGRYNDGRKLVEHDGTHEALV